MAMLYELARTWLGLYVAGRESCLSTVMYIVMMLREADEGQSAEDCDFFSLCMNQNDSLLG